LRKLFSGDIESEHANLRKANTICLSREKIMKRLGILTGGGDAPGLNAVIRAAVKTAIYEYGCEVVGIRDGKEVTIDVSYEIIKGIERLHLDALLVLGGDGTLHSAHQLYLKGAPIIGVPKTIDNDIGGTEVTFGFDTAVTTAPEAIDKLHTTAEAHHRVMVLELMGRNAGFITLHAGISGGADVILIPEIPFTFEAVMAKVRQRVDRGYLFSIVAVSEGAKPVSGEQVFSREGDEIYVPRLGGIGQVVGERIEKEGFETRVTVLGHVQRGGSPTPFDRWLATRYGAAAVRLAAQWKFDRMVSLQCGDIVDVSLAEATAVPKRVGINDDAVITARGMSIVFGDE
jgi:6-phosphofructokinase 1